MNLVIDSTDKKLLYFEYTLHKLLAWYKEKKHDNVNNDLGVLKSLKLLFFVTAAKTTSQNEDSLLDIVFNKFSAMPYGHVESEIYSSIISKNGELSYFIVQPYKTIVKKTLDTDSFALNNNLDEKILSKIDEALDYLKHEFENLILLPPFALVELSHLWYSWQKNYNEALRNNRRSESIPLIDIKSERKIFSLQAF